jgi:2-oxo-hept-3-ene-1,7-dioate hydratase
MKAADMLLQAERDRKPMQQLSTTWPDIGFEDAYAIQSLVQGRKIREGRRLIGHKVGLTSKAMQRSSQISEPDYGHLLDDMMLSDGAKVAHADYCVPRVEIELAFQLGKPLQGPGVHLTDVLRATEYIIPALEIVDARVQKCGRAGKVVQSIGNPLSGQLVPREPVPHPLEDPTLHRGALRRFLGPEDNTGLP